MNAARFPRRMSTRLKKLALCFFVLCSISLYGWAAQAQPKLERSFEIQSYDPAIGPRQYFTVESAAMPGNYDYGVALDYTFQHKPLSIFLVENDDLKTENVVMNWQNTLFVHGFFGINTKGLFGGYLFKQLQFGLSLPVYIQSGQVDVSDYPMPLSTPSEVRGFGLGDLRIHLKTSIWRFLNEKIRLAFSTTVTLPWVGDIPNYQNHNNFVGEKNVTIRPRVIGEFVHKDLRVAANVGFIARVEESQFFSTTVGHELLYGAAGEYGFWEGSGMKLSGLMEVVGRNGLSTELDENPLEVDAGVRVRFNWGLSVMAGGGAGLIKAVGSPLWRAFLRVQFAPSRTDSDGDGVPDYRDKCPGQKEDIDGFQDSDGCPDNDNDKDFIPDGRDKCPDKAEDKDGFEDNDGCPDADNDGDGVLDKQDNCPMDKGPKKHQGCPADMLDRDGDGIPDGRDKCPMKSEDKDGHEDTDGCPDPDNDGDGVCDSNDQIQEKLSDYAKVCKGKDKCPNKAEDKDGHEDEDGCPDPDNDGDGFCDDNPVIQKNIGDYSGRCVGKDKCPNKPEVINGRDDVDGCPDKGKPDVKITKNKVLLRRKLRFKRTSTRMRKPTRNILLQLVLKLRWKLNDFKKLVVVAFVEPKMRSSKAKRVTQAWADEVKKFLVKMGIPEDKIISKGLGGAKPVYTGSSRRKHRKINRRVEFFMVR